MTTTNFDLGTLNLSVGTHEVYCISRAVGFPASEPSNTVEYVVRNYPVKSDLISMNIDGENKQYRVLKINGSIAEVISFEPVYGEFSVENTNVYEESFIDNALSTTWYNALNETAKAAIVDKTFTQDSWYNDGSGNPSYDGYYGIVVPGNRAYTISLSNTAFGNVLTRHVYALSVQDILDYVLDTNITDGQLQNYNVLEMLFNSPTPDNNTEPRVCWFRSAAENTQNKAWAVIRGNGAIYEYNVSHFVSGVIPAFQIDLSKIDFSILT